LIYGELRRYLNEKVWREPRVSADLVRVQLILLETEFAKAQSETTYFWSYKKAVLNANLNMASCLN
jgi:hypothetical protein